MGPFSFEIADANGLLVARGDIRDIVILDGTKTVTTFKLTEGGWFSKLTGGDFFTRGNLRNLPNTDRWVVCFPNREDPSRCQTFIEIEASNIGPGVFASQISWAGEVELEPTFHQITITNS